MGTNSNKNGVAKVKRKYQKQEIKYTKHTKYLKEVCLIFTNFLFLFLYIVKELKRNKIRGELSYNPGRDHFKNFLQPNVEILSRSSYLLRCKGKLKRE